MKYDEDEDKNGGAPCASTPVTLTEVVLTHFIVDKDIDTMKTLYCSLVRPLLEYSCETWNPHTKRNIDKLEAVQRRATRWITRSDDDYDTRLSKLKLLSLFNRRFTRDVTFF